MFSGIRFVIDEHGDRAAVQIDLKEHGDLWEDFYDTLLVQARTNEPRESLEEVRRRLAEEVMPYLSANSHEQVVS